MHVYRLMLYQGFALCMCVSVRLSVESNFGNSFTFTAIEENV